MVCAYTFYKNNFFTSVPADQLYPGIIVVVSMATQYH